MIIQSHCYKMIKLNLSINFFDKDSLKQRTNLIFEIALIRFNKNTEIFTKTYFFFIN